METVQYNTVLFYNTVGKMHTTGTEVPAEAVMLLMLILMVVMIR